MIDPKKQPLKAAKIIEKQLQRSFVKPSIYYILAYFMVALTTLSRAVDEKPLGKNEGPFAETFLTFHSPEISAPIGEFHRQNDFHYVFITGLGGDYVPGYYRYLIAQLEKMGISKRNIHLISPSSRRTVETNLPWLKKQLDQVPGKLVVVAHSKGANEMFALAVSHSKFIENKVQSMYLLQASFFGSPIGDELLAELTHDQSVFTRREQNLIALDKIRGKIMYGFFFRQGLRSTSSRISKELNYRLRDANPEAKVIIQSKIFFITSETDEGLATRILNQYGPNDSINPLYTQIVPGWGTHLAHLDSGHIGFVLPVGREVEKRALMSTIFTHVEAQGDIGNNCAHLFTSLSPGFD